MQRFLFPHLFPHSRWAWLFVCLFAVGCLNPTAERANYNYTDDYGRTVQVPTQPTRIISTSPAVTEIIYALGAGDLLVGRTDFCTYPPQASAIESIGDMVNLNIEKILSLNPQLVISGSIVSAKATDHLTAMGIPIVFVLEKNSFDGLYQNISAIGRLIGREAQADSLNNRLKTTLSTIIDTTASAPTIYYVVGYGAAGNFTAGGNSFINDILRYAGARNIAEGIAGWSYSVESLLAADPDYIVIRKEDSAAFANTAPYSALSAVLNGRLIGIESGSIDLQVPRNLQAVRTIHQRISAN